MNTTANVGRIDKIVRLLAGAIFIALSFINPGAINTLPGIISLVVGAVLVVTALFNFCPAYKIFGISSCKKPK